MLKNIFQKLDLMSQSKRYWLSIVFSGLALLLAALFFQFYLEELPCVLCIQVRLWITLLVLVASFGLIDNKHKRLVLAAHVSIVLVATALIERSYQLLGTERGFVFGDCGFSLGLPSWFAIEEWLPWLYRVETSCGYTPEIMFGVTMAEVLMVFSICLFLFSFSIFVSALVAKLKNS